MKVALVNPLPNIDNRQKAINGKIPPLGLLYIAGNLQKYGHEVEIVDANANEYSNEITAGLVYDIKPEVVGVTCITPNFRVVKELVRILKHKLNVPIVIGGIHPTVLPESCLNTGLFDYIVIGEGEISFVELVNNLDDRLAIEALDGIGFKHNSQIVINKPRIIEDINVLPHKAWNLIDIKRYCPSPGSYFRRPAISTMFSRGCLYNCIYCCSQAIFKRFIRFHSIEIIASELEMFRLQGIRDINFWDNIFTKDRGLVIELCRVIKKLGLIWNCSTRVDMLDKEMLAVMADSGCYEIGYGLESASGESLRLMKKGTTIQQAQEIISLTRKLGIKTKCYFTIGYPWETNSDIEETIRFAKKIGADFATFSIVTAFPGCSLFEKIKNKFSEDDEFEDMNHLSGKYNVSEHLSRQQLMGLVNKGYRSFYLRPGYIWKAIKNIRELEDIMRNISAIKDIFFYHRN